MKYSSLLTDFDFEVVYDFLFKLFLAQIQVFGNGVSNLICLSLW